MLATRQLFARSSNRIDDVVNESVHGWRTFEVCGSGRLVVFRSAQSRRRRKFAEQNTTILRRCDSFYAARRISCSSEPRSFSRFNRGLDADVVRGTGHRNHISLFIRLNSSLETDAFQRLDLFGNQVVSLQRANPSAVARRNLKLVFFHEPNGTVLTGIELAAAVESSANQDRFPVNSGCCRRSQLRRCTGAPFWTNHCSSRSRTAASRWEFVIRWFDLIAVGYGAGLIRCCA